MSVTFNVGYSRKIGEPNYGSRGASVNLQIERETGLIDDPGAVNAQIEQLFALARAAVDAELSRSGQRESPAEVPVPSANGHAESTPITPTQRRAIRILAERNDVDLPSLLRRQGGSREIDQLTSRQAARLIVELNSSLRSAADCGKR